MKKAIFTVLALTLAAQLASAGELHCGASVESTPGSEIYNKVVFWEKADTSKSIVRFLLKDGTLLKSEELTPEAYALVGDGTLAMSISFNQERPQLFSGKVKRNGKDLSFTSKAMATSLNSNSPLLIANDVSLICKEM